MPNYEFFCDKCNKTIEIYLSIIKRNDEQKCSKCNKKMIRLIGTGESIIFKGDGWPGKRMLENKTTDKKLDKIKTKNK